MSGSRKGPKSEAERQRDRIRYLENARGIKHTIAPDAAMRRINLWRQKGVSLDTIAERTGVSKAQIRNIQNGVRGWIRTSTHAKIMGVQLSRADVSMFPAVGVRRRLQALAAVGYSTLTLGEILSRDRKYVCALQVGKNGREFVLRPIGAPVYEAYEKYAWADPRELGQTDHATTYVRNSARKNGWAPPHCWDDDTIDDPEAIPEWTGRCGTVRGYRIHYDEKIYVDENVISPRTGKKTKVLVLCRPCVDAMSDTGPGNAPKFERWEIDEMQAEGLTVPEMAAIFGVHERTLNRVIRDIREERERGN